MVSVRGRSGGYRLARPADEITLAEIIRAVDGPLVTVRDERPTALEYAGSAQALLEVWVALRVSVREVLDQVTLAAWSRASSRERPRPRRPARRLGQPVAARAPDRPARAEGAAASDEPAEERYGLVAFAAAWTAAGKALTMRSRAESSCAAETNQASNGDGGA